MNNNQLNILNNYKELYPLTNIELFKQKAKNNLIEYTNTNHTENYGLVSNILYNEMNDLIENIKSVTDNKMMIKDNYIYFVKDSELNFENIDNMYPEPVKNAFNNCINYFLKLQNI